MLIDRKCDDLSRQVLELGLFAEAFSGHDMADCTIIELVDRFAVQVDHVPQTRQFWFDESLRLTGYSCWISANSAVSSEMLASCKDDLSDEVNKLGIKINLVEFFATPGSVFRIAREMDRRLGSDVQYVSFQLPMRRGIRAAARQWKRRHFAPQRDGAAPTAPLQRPDFIEARRENFLNCVALGRALRLAAEQANTRRLPLKTWMSHWHMLTTLQQMHMQLDRQGNCDAWISWAWLEERAVSKLISHGPSVLDISDWSDGSQLVWMDSLGSHDAAELARKEVHRHWLSRGYAGMPQTAKRSPDGSGWTCLPWASA